MVAVGGPQSVVNAIKAAGGQPGPMSMWVTGGALKWGTGNIDTHYAACKAAGVPPLVKFWFWGDDISTKAINEGVKDQYQGTWKTREAGLQLAKTIGEKATKAGVKPIVAIEHEFAQNGLETDASAFGPYWDEAAAAIKAACPGAVIVFTVPIWEDEALIGKTYAKQVAKADMVGSQTLLFAPRHGSREFTNAGANFVDAFAKLRGLAPGKPACIVDLGFSSYGGPYAAAPPFAGGNGTANEPLQKAALDGIASRAGSMGLEFIVYRDLKDNAGFDVANYGGYAERHVGVVRTDGSKKPAFDSLVALAKPTPQAPPPEPKTRTETEYMAQVNAAAKASQEAATLLQSRDRLQAQVEAARAGVEAARTALAP